MTPGFHWEGEHLTEYSVFHETNARSPWTSNGERAFASCNTFTVLAVSSERHALVSKIKLGLGCVLPSSPAHSQAYSHIQESPLIFDKFSLQIHWNLVGFSHKLVPLPVILKRHKISSAQLNRRCLISPLTCIVLVWATAERERWEFTGLDSISRASF